MSTRADFKTARKQQTERYSDFSTNFDIHPVNFSLNRLTNENAIKRSIKNILLTNKNERLFNSNFGGNLTALLFEPMGQITVDSMRKSIYDTISNYEPRVKLSEIEIIPNEENQSYRVNIYFMIVNQKDPVGMTIVLRRIR